ncbi:MAG: hypothetical protein NTZ83_00315 [Candidatus Pacearchaeota archaeon]|nr:hypothetical protein [Candidatus Pacearchaeota archaeon]
MNITIFISVLVLIVLAAIFSIIGVCRSKKLGTLGKVVWVIVLFLFYFCLFWMPIIWDIAKARGIFH